VTMILDIYLNGASGAADTGTHGDGQLATLG
jgi:hypothetical protein